VRWSAPGSCSRPPSRRSDRQDRGGPGRPLRRGQRHGHGLPVRRHPPRGHAARFAVGPERPRRLALLAHGPRIRPRPPDERAGGVPAALDAIFGKILVPNAMVPPWLTEGMAVLHESGAGHGRNASALFDMYARAIVLEGGLFPLSEVSNPPLDWPLGNMWYLLGGASSRFLHERSGSEGLRAFLAEQGRFVWPFAIGWWPRTPSAARISARSGESSGRPCATATRRRWRRSAARRSPSRNGSPGAGPASSTRAGRRTAPSSPTGTAGSTARRASAGPRLPARTWVSPPRSPPTAPSGSSPPARRSSPSRTTTDTTGCGAISGAWTSGRGAGRG